MVVYMSAALENLLHTQVNIRVALQGENTFLVHGGYKILHRGVRHSYMYIVVKNCAHDF